MSGPQETLEDVKDAFRCLGLGFDAPEDDVKKNYRKLAIREHPDKNPGHEEEAKERFDKVRKAKDLLDKYAENRNSFLPGPSRRATIDPFDTDIPRGTNVQRETTASGSSRGERTRYYGPDGEELLPLSGGCFARVVTAEPPGTSASAAERSFRERHSRSSRSSEHRKGRQGSSFDRSEVREDGVTYIERVPTNVEPVRTPHKKKGKGDNWGKGQLYLTKDRTGKLDYGVKR